MRSVKFFLFEVTTGELSTIKKLRIEA